MTHKTLHQKRCTDHKKSLFCICERSKFAEQVNDFIVKGDIGLVFRWTSNREHGDEMKLFKDVLQGMKDGMKH